MRDVSRAGARRGRTPPRHERRSQEGRTLGARDGARPERVRAIVRRVSLPASHKDAMPPGGRRPLRWPRPPCSGGGIDQGARFDATLGDLELDTSLRPVVEALIGPLQAGAPAILAVKVPPADPSAIARVRALGVSVEPLAAGTRFSRSIARTWRRRSATRSSRSSPTRPPGDLVVADRDASDRRRAVTAVGIHSPDPSPSRPHARHRCGPCRTVPASASSTLDLTTPGSPMPASRICRIWRTSATSTCGEPA